MEINKDVRITNRKSEIETCAFDLEDSIGVSYSLENCRIVRTDPGKICYSGNLIIENDEGTIEKSALLWVEPNETGILVYNE